MLLIRWIQIIQLVLRQRQAQLGEAQCVYMDNMSYDSKDWGWVDKQKKKEGITEQQIPLEASIGGTE